MPSNQPAGDRRQTKSGHATISGVCCGGTQAADKTVTQALGERPANAKHADGADGRGDSYADSYAFEQKMKIHAARPLKLGERGLYTMACGYPAGLAW